MKNLVHLSTHTACIHPNPILFISLPRDGSGAGIEIVRRDASVPPLCYTFIGSTEGSLADVIGELRDAIHILKQLPDDATLEQIAAAMGTDLDDLEI